MDDQCTLGVQAGELRLRRSVGHGEGLGYWVTGSSEPGPWVREGWWREGRVVGIKVRVKKEG